MNWAYFASPRPRIFGHRGASGLAPENTVASFALAEALGADFLELDVHATADGVVVVLHDETLDRTTNGFGPVRDLPFAALQELDAGFRFSADGHCFPYRGQGIRVPTVEEVFDRFPARRLNIEIKQGAPSIVRPVVEVIERSGASDRVLLAAEHDSIMAEIRQVVGGRIATGSSVGEVTEFFGRLSRGDWQGYRPVGSALQIPPEFQGRDLVTHESVAAAHAVGLEVHVWTINDPTEVRRLLALGVDGVMSDFPGMAVVATRSGRA